MKLLVKAYMYHHLWILLSIAEKVESASPLLSCSEARTFWVVWRGGDVMVGNGAVVREHVLAFWVEDNPITVQGVAFSTANNIQGDWTIINPKGKLSQCCTGLLLVYWWLTSGFLLAYS